MLLIMADLLRSLAAHEDYIPVLDNRRIPEFLFVFFQQAVANTVVGFGLVNSSHPSLDLNYHFLVGGVSFHYHIADCLKTHGSIARQTQSPRSREPHSPACP